MNGYIPDEHDHWHYRKSFITIKYQKEEELQKSVSLYLYKQSVFCVMSIQKGIQKKNTKQMSLEINISLFFRDTTM